MLGMGSGGLAEFRSIDQRVETLGDTVVVGESRKVVFSGDHFRIVRRNRERMAVG